MQDYIFNQRKIPKNRWRYGLFPSSVTGCGWIAAYNAMRMMGKEETPESVIRFLEYSFPVINGNFGTFLFSVVWYFRRKGHGVTLTMRKRRFDEVLRKSDAGILFYYWRSGLRFGAHYVAAEVKNGRVYGYNTYCNSVGPDDLGVSLEEFVRKRRYVGTVLIGIKNKMPVKAKCR